MFKIVSFVFCLQTTVLCFTPNCIPENQYKFYDFPIDVCSDILSDICVYKWNGRFQTVRWPRVVKIRRTVVLPTCAFYNVDTLEHIYGVNSRIRVLADGAFINLPNLTNINLAYNEISEIRKNIFKNVSTQILDLSWNNIVYIEPKSFMEVYNLKELDLSKNLLLTIPINQLPKSLLSLNLAYNKLERIAINSVKFTNLTKIDLSNNNIRNIAIYFSYPLDIFDISNNKLKDLDFVEILRVQIFRIGSNQFTRVPRYVENINADKINIYPNPWDCQELSTLWSTMVSLNYNIEITKSETDTITICMNSTNNLLYGISPFCSTDDQCPEKEICKAGTCLNPCPRFCHKTSICTVEHGQFKCACPRGTKNNPVDLTGSCNKQECYVKSHCKFDEGCVDNKCIKVGVSTYPPAYPVPTDYDTKPWWFEVIPQLEPMKL